MRGHGWCPTAAPADGPGVVAGEPVVFCALAWQGRMIAGFAGTKLQSVAANGPGVAVRIGHDPRLVAAAEKMIAALGCAGLVSFEFRVEPGSGSPVLIACCPRPIPLGILGARIGADLAAELAALLRGAPTRAQPVIPTGHAELLLFPPALHVARRRSIFFADVPRQGPSVTHHVARARDREQRQRVWA